MGGFPVVFIGYELEDDALDIYQSPNSPGEATKSLLRFVESETGGPASIVRYDDSNGQTHKFLCCFADLSGRTYSAKQIYAIPVPSEFLGVPKRVKTKGELERKFSPSAMVNSYGADGKTRVDAGAVIGEEIAYSMLYNATIQQEAQYAAALGNDATEDNFYPTYTTLLAEWFPSSRGYVIDHQNEHIIVRHAGGLRNPLLIAVLKRPSKYTDAGKQEVKDELVECIEGLFDRTQYNTIYGLGGIGLKWMSCTMVKNGRPDPEDFEHWEDDITSDMSCVQFSRIADLVYNIS